MRSMNYEGNFNCFVGIPTYGKNRQKWGHPRLFLFPC